MRDNKEMTQQESLLIIQQMIDTAKHEQKDDGKGWIIWGWMLFLASTLTVINIHFRWFNNFFFWNVFGIITLLIGVYETIVTLIIKKKKKVKTYTRDIFEKLNVGFFICILFIIISMNVGIQQGNVGVSPMKGFPLLMNLYGFWILIYGAILNFKPSVIGAFITWGCAFAALFATEFQTVMILHSVAVLCGYIIPGHIAFKKFNEVTARKSYNQSAGV